MQKVIHRSTCSLPIPILTLSATCIPLLTKPSHFTTMASSSPSNSAALSFSLKNTLYSSSSSFRYSKVCYVRRCFCPTLTLTRHTTTIINKTLPCLLNNNSSNSLQSSSCSSSHDTEDEQQQGTTGDNSTSSSSSSTATFRLNRRQKASSSSSPISSSNPDLLAIPGVGPRNFKKLVRKGIEGVAQLKQLYKDKVASFLSQNN